MTEKYFELEYYITIIGLILIGLIIVIGIVIYLTDCLIYNYRRKSKKWEYDCVKKQWEKKK